MQPQTISSSFKDIGSFRKAGIRDLWKRKNIGVFKKKFQQMVDAHDALLLRVSPE